MSDRMEHVRAEANRIWPLDIIDVYPLDASDESAAQGYALAAQGAFMLGAHQYRSLTSDQWDAERQKAARAIALTEEESGCFEEVDAWEALDQWEKDAYPDEEPTGEREDCAYYVKRADSAMHALGFVLEQEATR